MAPATYRMLRVFSTAASPMLQSEIAGQGHASPAQASRLIRWLIAHGHAERQPDGRYRIRGAAGLVASALPYQRSMSDSLRAVIRVRGTPEEVAARACAASGVLCLETALGYYSRFFRPDRVAVYHARPAELAETFRSEEGGLLPLAIYGVDLPLDGDEVAAPERPDLRITDRFRTVLDMACDGKVYAAKEVLEELWGAVIG
ncbi:MAG: hypothetical protein L3K23_01790 [Thermoplasmata archaeon]|nr:hypothetical protein [Thermoplasmata archaeon]